MGEARSTAVISGTLGAVLLAVSIALFAGLALMSRHVIGASLPVIAIGSVTLLILLLTIVTSVFSMLGLATRDTAMGLPDGSVRAVIALSLIVLFAILSVFLYKGVAEVKINTVSRLSETERAQFIKDHPNLPDLQSTISKDEKGNPVAIKGDDGKPVIEQGMPKYLYDVTYTGSPNSASQDFAKQLLVLMGTLMTAITSFYLGAGTATSAAASQIIVPKPTIKSVSPTTFAIAEKTLHLQITGADLNTMINAKISHAGVQLMATEVKSSPTSVSCTIDVSKATAGVWDVTIDDGRSLAASLSGALTLT